jgi:hypothetical protein
MHGLKWSTHNLKLSAQSMRNYATHGLKGSTHHLKWSDQSMRNYNSFQTQSWSFGLKGSTPDTKPLRSLKTHCKITVVMEFQGIVSSSQIPARIYIQKMLCKPVLWSRSHIIYCVGAGAASKCFFLILHYISKRKGVGAGAASLPGANNEVN